MFINRAFTRENIRGMHETMVRLYEAAKKLKRLETPTEVARALNQSQQTINNWERRGISQGGMLKAQAEIGCSATWLQTGAAPMEAVKPLLGATQIEARLNEKSETTAYNLGAGQLAGLPVSPFFAESAQDLPSPTEDEFAFVPQLDVAAACGEGRYQDHVVVKGGLAFKRSSLRDFGVPEHAARIIYSSGGSMWPTIQDGRVVLINTADREPRDSKVYAVCKPDGELVLKRLVWDFHPAVGAQTWIMRSDNPDKTAHPDKVLPPDDRTMIAGRAVWNDNRL